MFTDTQAQTVCGSCHALSCWLHPSVVHPLSPNVYARHACAHAPSDHDHASSALQTKTRTSVVNWPSSSRENVRRSLSGLSFLLVILRGVLGVRGDERTDGVWGGGYRHALQANVVSSTFVSAPQQPRSLLEALQHTLYTPSTNTLSGMRCIIVMDGGYRIPDITTAGMFFRVRYGVDIDYK